MRSSIIAVLALASNAVAIDTISAYGAKLFTSSGAQFYIKGIAYQLTTGDPLVDTAQCTLDADMMSTIGTNSIRVYHVDASSDHDGCMSAFADKGIYIWVDLDTFDTAINGADPSWNTSQYDAFSAVMDTFQAYDNTAGFFVGNEVLNTGADSIAAPYVKAAARDMKAYRDKKGYRKIPVGYSAADIAELRPNLQNYLACGSDEADSVDFFSLNAYEWCGDSTYTESGYNELEANASSYNIPIFFSETGCNTPEPRLFTDQSAILGPDMDSTWSGAIIYEWIEVENNYGLISYGPSVAATATATNVVGGFSVAGTPTAIEPDWTNLSGQWATLTPTGTSSSDYTPSNSAPTCPPYTSGVWLVSGNVPLPTLGEAYNGASAGSTATTTGSSTGTATGTAATASSTSTKKSAAIKLNFELLTVAGTFGALLFSAIL